MERLHDLAPLALQPFGFLVPAGFAETPDLAPQLFEAPLQPLSILRRRAVGTIHDALLNLVDLALHALRRGMDVGHQPL